MAAWLGAADQPIHRKLTAIIRAAPTDEHFDPDKVECRVTTARGEIENLVIFHPFPVLVVNTLFPCQPPDRCLSGTPAPRC